MLGDDLKAIELRHLQGHAHIPEALAHYYAGAVADVASATGQGWTKWPSAAGLRSN